MEGSSGDSSSWGNTENESRTQNLQICAVCPMLVVFKFIKQEGIHNQMNFLTAVWEVWRITRTREPNSKLLQ